MVTRPDMVVLLRELPTTLDLELPAAFVREAIDGMPMRAALERPADDPDAGGGQIHLELYSEDVNVFVRGRIQGWMEVACSRCLGTARVPLDEELAITYLPKSQLPVDDDDADAATEPAKADAKASERPRGGRVPHEGEASEELGVELGDEDLDLYGYEGEEIDLAPMLREQLVLAVPFAPLCTEACKGLCPQCGGDRNQEACDCEPPGDPRLAALKNLKI